MADSFFRPGFTQGVWAEGQPFEHVFYSAYVGNSLNTLGVSTTKIDKNFVYAAQHLVGTARRLRPAWGRPDGLQRSRISRVPGRPARDIIHRRPGGSLFRILQQTQPENVAIYNSDGVLFFATGSLAPGVTVEFGNYYMWAQDFGFKYRGLAFNGQYFFRWLNDFRADGPLPLSETFDHGFEASVGYFVVPKTFELYGRTSAVFGEFRDSSEYAVGFNWHPWQNRGFRLIGEANRVQ